MHTVLSFYEWEQFRLPLCFADNACFHFRPSLNEFRWLKNTKALQIGRACLLNTQESSLQLTHQDE